jgi:hypothetical protein
MKPIQHLMGWTDARHLSQGSRPIGAIAQDGGRRARCRPEVMRHAAQLLCLPIRLGRHSAERDVLAVVVADLSDENLEGTPLVAANCLHMPAVDGKCNRSCFGRRSRGWQRRRFSLEPGADMQSPLADRLHLGGCHRAGRTHRAASGRGGMAARCPSWRGCVHSPPCSGRA